MNQNAGLLSTVLPYALPILTAILGYYIGSYKFFREQVLKAYEEILPEIRKYLSDPPEKRDRKKYVTALAKMWIYARKDAAQKLDTAISYAVVPERGDFIQAMQIAISAIRKDIQPWWRRGERNINADEIKHF